MLRYRNGYDYVTKFTISYDYVTGVVCSVTDAFFIKAETVEKNKNHFQ